jgi:ribosomal protein L11 methyltransferase
MPIWIGDGLIIASPSDAEYIRRDPRTILLSAGHAFGTGTHPTTQMCLWALQAHLRPGDRVVDVGTGSGILAVAAAKLGAERVVAVDRDVAACRMAQANARLNGFAAILTVVAGTPATLGPAAGFSLVLANLDSAIDGNQWLPMLSRLCRMGGTIILSGFQPPGEGLILAAVAASNLAHVSRRTEGGWITLVLRKAG